MKTFVKLQGQVKHYKQHSPKFATASVQIGEKDRNDHWHNYWVSLRIFNPTQPLHENINYTITGSLGVSPAYGNYPERMAINVKTIEPTQQPREATNTPQDVSQHGSGYQDPVAAVTGTDQQIPF